MKVHILSDLHTEGFHFKDPEPERDLVILAGDIGTGFSAYNTVNDFAKKCRTVFVPGNHEYYEGTPMKWLEEDFEAKFGDTFLQMKVVEHMGYRIAGCTLWTDMNNSNRGMLDLAARWMNDYRYIYFNDMRLLEPEDTVTLHKQMVNWLEMIAPVDIVVTHHAPSLKSVHAKYKSSPLNPAFYSELDWLVEKTGAKLWVHGHTHTSFDYMVGDCRVVANPRGYVNRLTLEPENREFDSELVIEV